MKDKLTLEEIKKEISLTEEVLQKDDLRAFRLWERIKINPEKWEQKQYPEKNKFWVIAILGNRCLYLNNLEGGWGWGKYKNWGNVSEYHYDSLDVAHVVYQTLFAIDNGGTG